MSSLCNLWKRKLDNWFTFVCVTKHRFKESSWPMTNIWTWWFKTLRSQKGQTYSKKISCISEGIQSCLLVRFDSKSDPGNRIYRNGFKWVVSSEYKRVMISKNWLIFIKVLIVNSWNLYKTILIARYCTMDGGNDQKNYMNNRGNPQTQNWHPKFF
jgi:hypothetical protein